MNTNIPYGQGVPIQNPPRRQDGSYIPMPPQMRAHSGYQPYYPQHMGPMMPQYPQHYAPNWYPYQQHQMHPHHGSRHQYYPQPHMVPPQYAQNHGPLVVSSHPHPHQSPRPVNNNTPTSQSQPALATATVSSAATPASASVSVSSEVPVQNIDSPNPSTVGPASTTHEEPPQATSSPVQQIQPALSQSPILDPAPVEKFYPPTPWLSVQDAVFPPRAPRRRRQIPRSSLAADPVTYPNAVPITREAREGQEKMQEQGQALVTADTTSAPLSQPPSQPVDQYNTPMHSNEPSEVNSTQPTTPSSVVPPSHSKLQQTPTQPKSRPAGPIIPAVPVLPQSPTATRRTHRDSVVSVQSKASEVNQVQDDLRRSSTASVSTSEVPPSGAEESPKIKAPAAPKSWADLVRSKNALTSAVPAATSSPVSNGFGQAKGETMSEVLNEMNSSSTENMTKVPFLQPRGLVNTGNMCYMNSVLQVLVFCTPFYDFLDKLARRAAHTFKSDTPLIDAIIMFMREYPIIDSANSVEQLRLRLKPEDYEKYGDSFTPEYVYSVINQLPRFRDMRRGHQQDAQEFLGFLLEELHEECAHAMRTHNAQNSGWTTPVGSTSNVSEIPEKENDGGWMEVGHKQRAAVTRSSGAVQTESPITNIFGGKLRSELKVSGNKLSVTLEPYQPLQLDIGSPQVHNIIDALKGLTRPESMQGDFYTSRGQKATATKQVFVETLPPVLILHLKRFHYDNTSKRAEKIWKKVGYPLELEIPKEVFPAQTRTKVVTHGSLPRYRLTGVIYHHGKNANGGHYTVDIRRQDGLEWIRLDDKLIHRVRSEDVAEGGSEEDPKILAAALESHRQGKSGNNRFEQILQDDDEEDTSDKVWSQVNGHSRTKSTMSALANGGTSTPARDASGPQTPNPRYSVKDNKVAYLLFYQRIGQ